MDSSRPRVARAVHSNSSDAFDHAPTIFAPGTPPGKSAISIIRISGPGVSSVWKTLRRRKAATIEAWPPPPRKALLREVRSSLTGEKLDEGIVIYFPSSRSLTGQDMLELHLHGSSAIMRAVLSSLSGLKGFRPAEPGEFTRLAFDNGRMDLTEVEGLRDLIESETEAQRKLAILQAGGDMRKAYEVMRSDIISAMSVVEAMIDFGEDESIHESAYEPARHRIVSLRDGILRHLQRAKQGEMIRNGARLAIFGAPNAGKSSLLNWLAQREASIVTSHPGTTRDVIELSLDFHGYPLIVSDTAGLRNTTDEVESIGVDRARRAVQTADIKLCMVSLPEALATGTEEILDPMTASLLDQHTLVVLNKIDECSLDKPQLAEIIRRIGVSKEQVMTGSVLHGEGLEQISDKLLEVLKTSLDMLSGGEPLLVTRERHRHHLEECLQCLDHFLDIDPSLDLVGAAEELRYAAQALGKVTGQIQVDEILDELFSSFCIGK